jgi:hypothetical protein
MGIKLRTMAALATCAALAGPVQAQLRSTAEVPAARGARGATIGLGGPAWPLRGEAGRFPIVAAGAQRPASIPAPRPGTARKAGAQAPPMAPATAARPRSAARSTAKAAPVAGASRPPGAASGTKSGKTQTAPARASAVAPERKARAADAAKARSGARSPP